MGRTVARIRGPLVGLCVALALLMSACASTSDPAPAVATASTDQSSNSETATAASPEPEDSTVETPASEQTDEADDTDDEIYASPIGEALGVAQDEIANGLETYTNDAEELVRSCMAEAGFDYTPIPAAFDQTARQNELQNTLSAEQFTAEYGFGISTLFELNFQGQGVVDFVNERFGPPPATERSPGEQAAYEMALNGQTTQGLTAEDAQEQLFDNAAGTGALDGSCRDYGYRTAENPGAVYDGLFSLLGDEFNALIDRFDNDQRIRDGWVEWQTCMATSGHSYENEFEIFDELFTSSNDIATQFLSSPQVLTALGQAQEQGFVQMSGDDRAAFLEEIGALQGFSWVPEVQAVYDDLVAFELRVAADSAECLDERLFLQVRFELETEFVETHADQLALLAAGDS